jgi:hypothetical protein
MTRPGLRRTGSTKALITSVLAVSAFLTVGSSVAWANHYYGIAEYNVANHGSYAVIRSNALSVQDPSGYFVDDDMWDVNPDASAWIEAGIIIGHFCTSGTQAAATCYTSGTYTNPRFFWTDSRCCGGGYHAHVDTSDQVSLSTDYNDKIRHENSDTWDVVVGPYSGTSNSNPLDAQVLETGTEETGQDATACNGQHGLSYWDTSDNYHNDSWPMNTPVTSDPPYAKWVSSEWLHDWSPASESNCF